MLEGGREGDGGMGTDAMDTLGKNVSLVGAEKLQQAVCMKQRCRKTERVKKNFLQMTKTQLSPRGRSLESAGKGEQ